MSEFQLAVLVYAPLQIASLLLLPRWWKAAALPGLIAAPGIFSHGGYMGDVFATLALIIACVYLLLPWAVFGIVRLAWRASDPSSAGTSSARRFVPVALFSPLLYRHHPWSKACRARRLTPGGRTRRAAGR